MCVYPIQAGAADQSKTGGARLNEKKPSFWNWLTGKKEEPQTPSAAGKFGYPENMPSDFAAAFQNQGVSEPGGAGASPSGTMIYNKFRMPMLT